MDRLSRDSLLYIFRFLPPRTLIRFDRVSKRFLRFRRENRHLFRLSDIQITIEYISEKFDELGTIREMVRLQPDARYALHKNVTFTIQNTSSIPNLNVTPFLGNFYLASTRCVGDMEFSIYYANLLTTTSIVNAAIALLEMLSQQCAFHEIAIHKFYDLIPSLSAFSTIPRLCLRSVYIDSVNDLLPIIETKQVRSMIFIAPDVAVQFHADFFRHPVVRGLDELCIEFNQAHGKHPRIELDNEVFKQLRIKDLTLIGCEMAVNLNAIYGAIKEWQDGERELEYLEIQVADPHGVRRGRSHPGRRQNAVDTVVQRNHSNETMRLKEHLAKTTRARHVDFVFSKAGRKIR